MVEPLTIARVVIRLEVAVLYKYKEKEDTESKWTISKTNTDFDNPNKTTNNDFIKALSFTEEQTEEEKLLTEDENVLMSDIEELCSDIEELYEVKNFEVESNETPLYTKSMPLVLQPRMEAKLLESPDSFGDTSESEWDTSLDTSQDINEVSFNYAWIDVKKNKGNHYKVDVESVEYENEEEEDDYVGIRSEQNISEIIDELDSILSPILSHI